MKILLDVKINDELKEDDILIYNQDSQCFENVHLNHFFKPLDKKDKNLQEQIDELNQNFKDYKEKMNEKLNSYHKILNVITKGE